MHSKNNSLTLLLCIVISGCAMAQCSVNIQPPASLQFCSGNSITLTASGTGGGNSQVLDQSQTVYTGGTSARTLPGYSEWQSFTAGITGTLVRLDIGFFTLINGNGQLKIFAGAGTSGTLLSNQTVSVVCNGGNCTLPFTVSVPVMAGQVYTFQFIPGTGMPDPYGIQVQMSGTYAGGEMNIVDPSGTYPTGFDMVFNTYVAGTGTLYYHWSTGSDSSTTVVSAGGLYYVSVTDSATCTAIDSVQLTEDIVTVNITADQTTVCASDSAQLCTVGGFSSYLWNNSKSDSCITVKAAGSYYLTVTDINGCSAESNHLSLNVHTPPSVSISVNGDTLSAYNAASYQWYLNGTLINDATNNAYILDEPGSYTVAVTDSNGCSATSSAIVISVVPEVRDHTFALSPNPTNNQLNITIDETMVGAQLNIYSSAGTLVQNVLLLTADSQLSTSTLPAGIYIAEVNLPTGRAGTKEANVKKRWVKM